MVYFAKRQKVSKGYKRLMICNVSLFGHVWTCLEFRNLNIACSEWRSKPSPHQGNLTLYIYPQFSRVNISEYIGKMWFPAPASPNIAITGYHHFWLRRPPRHDDVHHAHYRYCHVYPRTPVGRFVPTSTIHPILGMGEVGMQSLWMKIGVAGQV